MILKKKHSSHPQYILKKMERSHILNSGVTCILNVFSGEKKVEALYDFKASTGEYDGCGTGLLIGFTHLVRYKHSFFPG